MQQIFYTKATPEEYYRQGKEFPFPVPTCCPNPACRVEVPPRKHDFYFRNVVTGNFIGRIPIRRYYCKYCGKTVSYLPSFCLPHFQHTVDLIYTALEYLFAGAHSLRTGLQELKTHFRRLYWERSHLQFYARRFLANLERIKVGLRQLIPRIQLPDQGLNQKKGAQKVLRIVATGFPQIQTFSTRYFDQCRYSFMAPADYFSIP